MRPISHREQQGNKNHTEPEYFPIQRSELKTCVNQLFKLVTAVDSSKTALMRINLKCVTFDNVLYLVFNIFGVL